MHKETIAVFAFGALMATGAFGQTSGDASHQEARDAMKGRWRHPKKSMGWYRETKQAFAALPED